MLYRKKEGGFIVVFAILVLLFSGLFLAGRGGEITGKVIVGGELAIPMMGEENDSLDAVIVVDTQSSDSLSSQDVINNDSSSFSVQNIGDGQVFGARNLNNADSVFNGVSTRDNVGKALAFGDLNNDGYNDLVVGLPDAVTNLSGMVYVVFGTNSGFPTTLNSSNANVMIVGNTTDGGGSSINFGYSLLVTDINNDSISDLVVGAIKSNNVSGGCFVYYGPLTNSQFNSSLANIIFSGIMINGNSGTSLATGDINGDGVDDLVVGSYLASNLSSQSQSGEIAVIYGNTSFPSKVSLLNASVRMFVSQSSVLLGSRRGLAVGRVNNDIYEDILISGSGNNGQAYLVYGNPNLPATINLSSTANFTLSSAKFSAVSMGDLNGDGFFDLIGGYSTLNSNNGKVYVYYGPVNGSQAYTVYNFSIAGSNAEKIGYDLGVGDYNNDGKTDLLISAPSADTNGHEDSGAVYLFYGPINYTGTSNNISSSGANITFKGISVSNNAGYSIVLGNINNDRFADVIIGADMASPNNINQAGQVYLSYGKVTCSYIDTNITLNQNIMANDSCFVINNSNIILDGAGYTITGNGSGIALNVTSVSNVMIKNVVLNNFTSGIYTSNALNITLKDSFVNNTIATVLNATNSSLYFTNVSFNKASSNLSGNASLYVQWYIDVYVNDTNNNPLVSAIVFVYNITNLSEQSSVTDTLGFARFTISEYFQNSTSTIYLNNYSINVTRSMYSPVGYYVNLSQTNNTILNFNLNFSGCGIISLSILMPVSSINTTGTCFTVNGSSLEINGSGLTIQGNGQGSGFNITPNSSAIIRNVNILNFTRGINLQNGSVVSMYHSKITNSTNNDVYLENDSTLSFYNTSFNRNNVTVEVGNSTFNVSWYVNVFVNNSIFVIPNVNVTFTNGNNDIDSSSFTDASGHLLVLLKEFSESRGIRFFFTPETTSVRKLGYVNSTQVVNLTLMNSTVLSFNMYGNLSCGIVNTSIVYQNSNISASGDCINITQDNIIINGSSSIITGNTTGRGFFLNSVNNVTINDFIVKNFSNAFSLVSSYNNTIHNFKLVNNTIGVHFSSSDSNNFTDGQIVNSSSKDVNVSSGTDNIFTNISMDKNSIASEIGTTLIMKWYASVQVNDTNGAPLNNATITAYKADGTVEETEYTNSNGSIRLTLSEFSKDEFGYTYITPHTITAFKPGYFENSTTVDISATNNTNINFSLGIISCNSTLTKNITLGSNLSSSGNCFTLNNNNVIINGNGYRLQGNGTGTGIRLANKANIIVGNLTIVNYTSGISLLQTNNSVFRNLNISNTSVGVEFNYSHNNVIYDSVLDSNNVSVFAINSGETNNSLVNVSVDINTINVSGTASIYLKWYVNVNVTYGSANYPLQNANVMGIFNNTGLIDHSVLSSSNGIATLILAELMKNASGVYYLTPHNITAFYNSTLGYSSNSTGVNLSLTNNTNVILWLNLSCTAPYDDLLITSNTNLCPGTWNIVDGGMVESVIRIGWPQAAYNVTCDNTVLVGSGSSSSSGSAFNIKDVDGVVISGCTVKNYYYAIKTDNSTIDNLKLDHFYTSSVGNGIYGYYLGNNFILSNFEMNTTNTSFGSGITDMREISGVSNWRIENGSFNGFRYGINFNFAKEGNNIALNSSVINNVTFKGESNTSYGIYRWRGYNNVIKNSIFTNNGYGIYVFGGTNNSFYNNTFSSSSVKHALVDVDGSATFNISINGIAQGNSWDDLCGIDIDDSNGDGYGDSGTQYPYNSSYSSMVQGYVTDYGPIMLTCPSVTASGAASSSSSSSTTAASGSAPPAAVAQAPPPPAPAAVSGSSIYDAQEAMKYLKTESIAVQRADGQLQVSLTLENTGEQTMELNPVLNQEIDDPLFIVTRKTLGAKGSIFNRLAGLSYSENPIAGKLLRSVLVTVDTIVIPPGEKVQKTLEIKEGFAVPKVLKIEFETFGETVMERDVQVERRAISAAAVDVNDNLVDIYALIIPEGEDTGKVNTQGSLITGAVIKELIFTKANSPYYLELSMVSPHDNSTVFSDYYGPYTVKPGQSFLFAQQLNVDKTRYSGDYLVDARVYHGNALVMSKKFEVMFGEAVARKDKAYLVWLAMIGILVIVILQGFYLVYVARKKKTKDTY